MTLSLTGVAYSYPGGDVPAVHAVNLVVSPGEFVLVTGPTGCGKSTLLRVAAGLAGRHGQGALAGEVLLGDQDPASARPSERVEQIGFVTQTPSDQLVAGTVADEVAFGPESAGWAREPIERRVSEMIAQAGLQVAPTRSPRELSGGQQQRLVVAAALAGGAQLLLLDEPISQLDPLGAAELLARLRALVDGGATVVLAEHRLEACLPFVDRVVVMAEGDVVSDAAVGAVDFTAMAALGLEVPGLLALEGALAAKGRSLHDIEARPAAARELQAQPARRGGCVLSAASLTYRYPGADQAALDDVALAVWSGERVAVLGANGAGKSTLLAALAGHLDAGLVKTPRGIVDVPQNPDLALFCPTVRDEVGFGPGEAGMTGESLASTVADVASRVGVSDLLERPPQALSRGQRLRVAVGAALACDPGVLLLDEPTSGQDRRQVEQMMRALAADGDSRGLVFVTHDVGLALTHATRVVVLDEGKIVAEGPPREALTSVLGRVPLRLPPLAAWCFEHELPVRSPEELAVLLCGAEA